MEPEIIETKSYIFKIYSNDLLEYIVKENAVIDAQDVLEGKKLLSKAWPSRRFYILATGIIFFTFTKEAREITSTKEYGDNTHAVAFVTTNPSVLLLGKLYMNINKPYVPTRIFNTEEDARNWLAEKMNAMKGEM